MGSNPSRFKGPDNPVETVSWDTCHAFLAKLSEAVPGRAFRLPTEAEWEHAARAGRETLYYYDEDKGRLSEHMWNSSNSGGTTHPVGQLLPNEWGLYDLAGNVWEWCQDWYGGKYYADSPRVDPPGPPTGTHRVVRGLNFREHPVPRVERPANRGFTAPGAQADIVGLRAVMNP